MNKKRIPILLVGGVAAVTGLAVAPASAIDRGVSMERACNVQYSGINDVAHAYVGNPRDVYSWYCATTDGKRVYRWGDIDVRKACVNQYGSSWRAGFSDRNNAYSWYCRK